MIFVGRRHADDICSHFFSIIYSPDLIRHISRPVCTQITERHDRHIFGNADSPETVADGADRAGAVRAVSVRIKGHIVIIIKIPAVHIIDESVTVIVNAVSRDLSGIDINIVSKIRVSIQDTGIDNGNDHV